MPGKVQDLTGKQFKSIHVIKQHGFNKWRTALWNTECLVCGYKTVQRGVSAKRGSCASCGHISRSVKQVTHGESKTQVYRLWADVKQRCTNPKSDGYHRYGGRGITMYPAWLDDYTAFRNWINATLGDRPDGTSIDRIDNDGNYEPGNLRWATPLQQSYNRGDNVFITIDGTSLPMREWATAYRVPYKRMIARYYGHGWRGVKLLLPKQS